MSLLRDIQATAIASDTDITVLLRKCKVLAARLGNEQFKNWVDSELNGYNSADELPQYRILKVSSKGDFAGSFGSGLKNGNIPITCLPEEYREKFSHSYLIKPISYYEPLVKNSDSAVLQEPWAPEFVAYVGQQIYEDMNCLSAWKVIPRGSITSLIDVVRNKVLNFVLEIEAENPEAGDAPINSNPVPQEKVTHIFNTYISGSVQNVAAGSTNVKQTASIDLRHNKEAIVELLRTESVPETDINEMLEAIDKDKKDNPSQDKIGPKVTLWISGMLKKAVSGVWKVGTSVATTVLVKAISAYYGLDQ
jgi:hypothetical protein